MKPSNSHIIVIIVCIAILSFVTVLMTPKKEEPKESPKEKIIYHKQDDRYAQDNIFATQDKVDMTEFNINTILTEGNEGKWNENKDWYKYFTVIFTNGSYIVSSKYEINGDNIIVSRIECRPSLLKANITKIIASKYSVYMIIENMVESKDDICSGNPMSMMD